MSDLADELDRTLINLNTAMGHHIRAVSAAERLNAVALAQSDGLKASAKLIKFLMSKASLTKEERDAVARDYQALKDSFSTGARVRDNVREDFSAYADATRIFEHSDNNRQTPEMDEWLVNAAQTSDANSWYEEQKWDR